MNVSPRCWSPFHTNECVFSRNEQQKVYYKGNKWRCKESTIRGHRKSRLGLRFFPCPLILWLILYISLYFLYNAYISGIDYYYFLVHVPFQTVPEAPEGGGEGVTYPFILLIIQDFKLRTLAYTVGFSGDAQGRPVQLAAPSRYHLPPNSHTSGPPLSP